jgi:hypothetical protein
MLNRRRHRVIALRCKGLVDWSVTQREHSRPKQSLRRLRGGRRADDSRRLVRRSHDRPWGRPLAGRSALGPLPVRRRSFWLLGPLHRMTAIPPLPPSRLIKMSPLAGHARRRTC